MRELLCPDDPRAARAPRHVREQAAARGSCDTGILHIVWDEEGGFPETGWGFEQWSVRPYLVGQGCDGTIEGNMHLVALELFPRLGIDYRALYEEAYPGESLNGWPPPDVAATLAAETHSPTPDGHSIEALLHDLYDTNHRTLEDLLRTSPNPSRSARHPPSRRPCSRKRGKPLCVFRHRRGRRPPSITDRRLTVSKHEQIESAHTPAVLAVECPRCKAPAGRVCWSCCNNPTFPHTTRVAAAARRPEGNDAAVAGRRSGTPRVA